MKHNKRSAKMFSWILAAAMIFSLTSGIGISPSVYAADTNDSAVQTSEDTAAAPESTTSGDTAAVPESTTSGDTAVVPESTGSASWQSYRLSAYNNTDTTYSEPEQHVVLTLTYAQPVTITDEAALNNSIFGTDPTLILTIAGSSITDSDYYRPCTYSVSGSDLMIDMGNVVDPSNNNALGFTAIYNGSFTASGSISGISVGGTAVSSDVNIAETRIPVGVEFSKVSGWDTNAVTMQVSHKANVRAMYHFAVYKVIDDTASPATVVPVTAGTGQMNAYTMTSHAHMFYTMTTANLAKNIVSVMSSSLPTGYTASLDGSNFTVTSSDSADKLRVYMYDDNFIQSNDCQLQISDPGVSFAADDDGTVSDSLSGTGSVYFKLNVTNPDGLAAWAANATLTVDGIAYTVVMSEPSSYTVVNSKTGKSTYYAYLEKYVGRRGTTYYLNIATSPLNCSGGQATKHIIAIDDKIGSSISQEVTLYKYAANSFRVRYIDENGNIAISKMYTMDQLKNKFASVTQDYSTVCTMAGVRTFQAEGVLLEDLLNDCGIAIDDNMTIQLRTNDSTTQGINDPGDRIGEITEGYYSPSSFDDDGSLSQGSGQFDSTDLFAARYYYPSVYDDTTTFSDLGGSTIYSSLKSISGQLIRNWGTYADTSAKLRKVLPATADKTAVTPLIAWQYTESIFGSDGKAISTTYDSTVSNEKSFRFLFGIKEENGEVALQTTTWSATYEAFGIDFIENSEAVTNAKDAISAITDPVTLDSKDVIDSARTAFDAVPEADQNKVSNYNTLWNAEAEYGILNTTDLINKIGTPVTKDSGDAIAAARAAYDALSDDSKEKVTNYDTLTAAETAFAATRVSNIFTDVHSTDWFNEGVQFVYDNGIMTGKNAATFAPNTVMTRAEFVTILYRMAGSPSVTYTDKFKDVAENTFYASAVLWASQKNVGIVNGYVNGNFGPSDPITREQLTLMLFRYAKLSGLDTSASNDLSSFPDKGNVSGFAADSMKWAVGAGLITGDSGKLNPQGTATRGQAATIIYRLLKK